MNVKARAMHAEDKEERRHAILDAAEQLLLTHPQRIVSVDEVAAEAGLAKGTVYLYFPSKEELLLARGGRGFWDTKSARLKWMNCSIVTAAMPIQWSRNHETRALRA